MLLGDEALSKLACEYVDARGEILAVDVMNPVIRLILFQGQILAGGVV